MIDKPMPELSEWAFDEFYRNGNRINYEALYFGRRKFLAVYGLKAIALGSKVDSETLDKLNYVLFEVLSEDTWALPAHANKYTDPDWEHTVDLFACETASALGLIYRYAGDYLPDYLKKCILHEVKTRVLFPFFKEGKSFGWEGCSHNWNAVCCGGIGIALLTLGQMAGFTVEEVKVGTERIKKSLRTYLDTAFSGDGVSLEGVGYFNYGMSFYLAFAAELKKNGDNSLLDGDRRTEERLKQLGDFIRAVYLKNGYCVNFSDAKATDKILPGIAYGYRCAGIDLKLPETAYAGFNDDTCYRFAGLYLSLCGEETGDGASEACYRENGRQPMSFTKAVFDEAQWAIFQSENGTAFAIKGGHNAEPHNHNDIGSFIYYAGDRCLACDLGQGEYTADYFGNGRYDYLCCSSGGHNTPVVNGHFQEAGPDHKATSFSTGKKGDRVTVTIEFHLAYPLGTCGFLQRNAEFDLKNGNLLITDLCDRNFAETLVTREEKVRPCVIKGSEAAERSENFSNHEGIPEKIILKTIEAKKTEEKENEIFTDGNNSAGLYSASFSLSAGLL